MGYHVDDDCFHVLHNRRLAAKTVGGVVDDWVVGQQVHGTRVHVVDESDRGRGGNPQSTAIEQVDALVTNIPGITLVVMTADCVPILFYDPVHQAIGTAHSGWKGTVGHVTQSVIQAMQDTYGTEARDIRVSLGPSIRACCYEVNSLVQTPITQQFGSRPLQKSFRHPEKYMLSLHKCILDDLRTLGVRSEHVEDTGVCTACNTHTLFSHRAEHGRTGRQLGAIRIDDDVKA
jgi:polyphenol oxidase